MGVGLLVKMAIATVTVKSKKPSGVLQSHRRKILHSSLFILHLKNSSIFTTI